MDSLNFTWGLAIIIPDKRIGSGCVAFVQPDKSFIDELDGFIETTYKSWRWWCVWAVQFPLCRKGASCKSMWLQIQIRAGQSFLMPVKFMRAVFRWFPICQANKMRLMTKSLFTFQDVVVVVVIISSCSSSIVYHEMSLFHGSSSSSSISISNGSS